MYIMSRHRVNAIRDCRRMLRVKLTQSSSSSSCLAIFFVRRAGGVAESRSRVIEIDVAARAMSSVIAENDDRPRERTSERAHQLARLCINDGSTDHRESSSEK